MTARSPEITELGQLLMVEVTGRLEDLAAEAAGLQRSSGPAPDMVVRLIDVLKLAEAREIATAGRAEGRRRGRYSKRE